MLTGPTASRSLAVLALCLATGPACGGDPAPGRPIGAVCAETVECGEGECLAGRCLDPDGDEDRDTLPNGVEVALGTMIDVADTDGDGLSDRDEVTTDLKAIDSDGDGKHDALESDIADEDGDCVSDQRDAERTDHAAFVASLCTKRVGVCAGAVLDVSCADPKLPACDYAVVPGYEEDELSCDDRDNDCDGATDEGLADCHGDLVGLDLVVGDSLEVGSVAAAVLTASYEDASERDVTAEAEWLSSDPSVTAVAGRISAISAGSATITARFGGLSAQAEIAVYERPVVLSSIVVDEQHTPVGVSVTFLALGRYSDESEAPLAVAWSSSRPEIAAIDEAGVVTAIAVGTTTIRASLDDVEGTATLTVTPAEPVAVDIALTTETPRVAFDGAIQLRALALLTDGNEADYSDRVAWRSSNAERATVSALGLVTGHALGPVEITAELAAVIATTRLDVVVALVPLVVATNVRATVLGRGGLAPVRASAVRVVRMDGAGVVVGRPTIRVEQP